MNQTIHTDCCIAGGGPAGMMLGFLLARVGVDVTVLEKWQDFFRDFRGDTIHPSTMEILHELGLLEEFLKLPHSEIRQLEGEIGGKKIILADFSHLNVHCPFIALIPQWDFLNFIAEKAKKYQNFHLLMETEAIDLIKNNDTIVGVRAKNKNDVFEIHSKLVVGADGRSSTVREKSELIVNSTGAPMDVLWFRISRKDSDSVSILGKVDKGKMLIMLNRNEYWQCGYLIRKGDFDKIKQAGLDSFQKDILEIAPMLNDRVKELTDWEKIKLLTVKIEHLDKWYLPGLICIGDAAHAMSPIGGVGINLAIQDAVGAANILIPAFHKVGTGRDLSIQILHKIQQRRAFPARVIQRIQVIIQNRVISNILGNEKPFSFPLPLKLVQKFPYLRRIPAYFVGMGLRREHVK